MFKIIQYSFLSVFLILVSCNKERVKKPKNLIPKDTMTYLLMDMHLANRSRNIKTKNGDRKPKYFPLIYKKYHIDSTRFKESHTYYMQNLPQYIAIYKKLEDSITNVLKKEEKQLKINDSITKLQKKKKLKKLDIDPSTIKKLKKIQSKKKIVSPRLRKK